MLVLLVGIDVGEGESVLTIGVEDAECLAHDWLVHFYFLGKVP